MLRKKHALYFLILIIMVSAIAFKQPVLVVVAAAVYLFRDILKPPRAEVHSIDMCSACDEAPGPAAPVKKKREEHSPLDLFNTYDADYMSPTEGEAAVYAAQREYSDVYQKEINPVYDLAKPKMADEQLAQMARTQQLRSREAADNRARLNVNTFKPYFEEDLITNENAPWWGDNPDLLF